MAALQEKCHHEVQEVGGDTEAQAEGAGDQHLSASERPLAFRTATNKLTTGGTSEKTCRYMSKSMCISSRAWLWSSSDLAPSCRPGPSS